MLRDLGLEGAKASKLPGSKKEQTRAGGGPSGAGGYPMNSIQEEQNFHYGRGKGRGEVVCGGDVRPGSEPVKSESGLDKAEETTSYSKRKANLNIQSTSSKEASDDPEILAVETSKL